MKRTNIILTDADQRAILIIRERYAVMNDTAAIRFALCEMAREIEIEYLKRNLIEPAQRGAQEGE